MVWRRRVVGQVAVRGADRGERAAAVKGPTVRPFGRDAAEPDRQREVAVEDEWFAAALDLLRGEAMQTLERTDVARPRRA